MTIAAVIITKDEEQNIADCLESVRWADERIVVDAESRDRTVELARLLSRRCLCAPGPVWATENFGIDQAGSDWILVVDADERVTDGLRQEIQALLAADHRPTSVDTRFLAGTISTGNGFKAAGCTGPSTPAVSQDGRALRRCAIA